MEIYYPYITKKGECRACQDCVNACPAKARYFGNLDDPDDEVAMLKRQRKAEALHPEYETDPGVFYIS